MTFLYSVKVWVDPDHGQDYLAWLTGGHVADVARAPGVLWAHLARLDDNAPDGWMAFQAVYAFESRPAFEVYQGSELYKSFMPIWQRYAHVFRIERQTGNIIESHDRKPR
ncbi:MAG: hypothetical protein EP335_14880 [Alphaproteobacteria bacterium]|nr:MAG: hypothetical protein EP335_14880 [Alphaproteobacteria bacterium]